MASPLAKTSAPAAGKMRLVRELLGPYHRWLALILAMPLVATATSKVCVEFMLAPNPLTKVTTSVPFMTKAWETFSKSC